MKVAVIVPVSPFESEEILRKSIEHLKNLDYADFDVRILYVIDRVSDEDRREKVAEEMGVEVLLRNNRRGKRAGAINDALDFLSDFNPDYIAIFDVDSRPERNFVVECVKALESYQNCYIASSKRYIYNGINLVSETVEAEYYFINFLLKRSRFKQFNGMIGVLKGNLLMENRLNEWAAAEDADFATRMHAERFSGILVETTKLHEQAPLTWKDLYSQRKRWYYGGIQLWRYRRKMRKARRSVRLSWYMALTLTYLPVLYIPFIVLLSPILLLYHYRRLSKVKVVVGLVVHALLLQIAAVNALMSYVRGRDVEWDAIKRVVD
ncbi:MULTISPECIES: glycosyltransferase [unclassified Archaeoglobus]|jgi:cellulose synthase/poly-beta-1,6-N-acetylglucosamine synthase-like glycosyltransferase|uniref:glycosyltransferase n=1 Tax=unclassified Archaeoglobus TaxID=2643606 RepID=UPI0025BAB2AB|nr:MULTISPECIES: glycosyltransferase family 2 protein [unclassified Archaeoglobus]